MGLLQKIIYEDISVTDRVTGFSLDFLDVSFDFISIQTKSQHIHPQWVIFRDMKGKWEIEGWM